MYDSMVCRLQYLNYSGPDITFAVSQVLIYASIPTSLLIYVTPGIELFDIWKVLPTPSLITHIRQLTLITFSDAYWVGDPSDRCSVCDFIIFRLIDC